LLRSDFEQHPLWGVLDAVNARLETIAQDGDLNEVAPSELARVLVSHVQTFRALATTSPLLFTNTMMNDVQTQFGQALGLLDTRIAVGVGNPAYVQGAVANAEAALIAMAPWPRPYAKGAQIQATTTMFEDLLERQRISVESLEAAHQRLLAQVANLSASATTDHDAAAAQLAEILREAESVATTVDGEKARIDEVVSDGLKKIAGLEQENSDRYKAWQDARAESFAKDFGDVRKAVELDREKATVALAKLVETNQQFENLTTLAAGDIIAGEFKREAKWGRVMGLIAYGVGFIFIGLGAVPLIILLTQNPDTKDGLPDWGRIIVRIAIAVLAGSAATVVITLGARLIRVGNLSKRMDLELRSFGPFLANVKDTDPVDDARIELLKRAFGNGYSEPEVNGKEEVVQVSTLMQIINGVSKVLK
jgi:hypothetical protein